MMRDESGFSLASLIKEMKDMAPDVLDCSKHYLILPSRLGDLEKPECLAQISDKIQKLKQAKDLFDSGKLTMAEYCAQKTEILARMPGIDKQDF